MTMIATHVDDILRACEPEYEKVIDGIKKIYKMESEEQTNFQYCGVVIHRFDDFSIKVTCE